MSGKILIVDDDPALRMTLEEILLEEGRDVMSAEDGLQAVKLASEGSFALILMDIQMPNMNGVDAYMKIKEILPECVVVLMTGFSVEALVQKALEEGVYTVLPKPVALERIFEILDQVVPQTIPS